MDKGSPSPGHDDWGLIGRAAEGDREAYQTLFDRHAERIGGLAYLLLHSSPAAEDAVQETFTKGLAHARSFRGECEPRVWLTSIALNVCRRHLRDEKRREGAAAPWELEEGRRMGHPFRGVVTSAIRRETGRQLALALGYLTPSQREVFVLHYTDGLPYDTLAPMLHMTPVAARALAHRARRILRDRLPQSLTSITDD